jgi:tRNA-specific 2-thiouridylase
MNRKGRVAVALSGGVDSAVAAALLASQGWEVVGVHLLLSEFIPPNPRVRQLARALDFALLEMDLRQDFQTAVVDYFTAAYRRGLTPNPCVQCNALIKFGVLWERLQSQGFSHLATGHYAQVLSGPDTVPALYRGLDPAKDQSYFLCRLPRQLLPHLLFPLGRLTKQEVKARFQAMALPGLLDCAESQEVCFIQEKNYRRFLRAEGSSGGQPGYFTDRQGCVLGRHRGVEHYTVGQRRGLGLPSSEPYFVLEIQPEANRVILGRRAELAATGLTASHVHWLIDTPAEALQAQTVVRYRHAGVAAQITPVSATEARVIFASPQTAVSPGQAVVFYRHGQVLGSGWIRAALKV